MATAGTFNDQMEQLVARVERSNDKPTRRFGKRFGAAAAFGFGQLTDEQRALVDAKLAELRSMPDGMFVVECANAILSAAFRDPAGSQPELVVIVDAMFADAARRHRDAGHSKHCKGDNLYAKAYRTIGGAKKRRCTCGHGK